MTADGVRGPGSGPFPARTRADLTPWQPSEESATEHAEPPATALDAAAVSAEARDLRDRVASARERAASAVGGKRPALATLDAARRATARLARQIVRSPDAAVSAHASGLDEQRVIDLTG